MRKAVNYDKIDTFAECIEDFHLLPANPMVSVCVTTYNHEKFIQEALDGIIMQQVKFPYEIIIGEDHSKDSTREIVIAYQKKYPDKIRLRLARENLYRLGYSPGGIIRTKCRGKYITMCDGDDYWTDPLKLQKQVDFLEVHEECAGCFHETQKILEDGTYGICFGKNAKSFMTVEDTLEWGTKIHISSFVFRNIVHSFPDWIQEVRSGDMALYTILASYGLLGKVPGVMSIYRIHEGGVSQSKEFIKNRHVDRIKLLHQFDAFHNFKHHEKVLRVITEREELVKWQERVKDIPPLSELDPDYINNGLALYKRASILEQENRLDESEKLFFKVEQFPMLNFKFGALYHLGVIQWKRKNYKNARNYFRKSLKYEPDHLKAIEYLSKIEGQFDE